MGSCPTHVPPNPGRYLRHSAKGDYSSDAMAHLAAGCITPHGLTWAGTFYAGAGKKGGDTPLVMRKGCPYREPI